METFRSEDINSILALPAIYSGDFQSASHGEQCASVSGSLLNGLELDTSTRFVYSLLFYKFTVDSAKFTYLKTKVYVDYKILWDKMTS